MYFRLRRIDVRAGMNQILMNVCICRRRSMILMRAIRLGKWHARKTSLRRASREFFTAFVLAHEK